MNLRLNWRQPFLPKYIGHKYLGRNIEPNHMVDLFWGSYLIIALKWPLSHTRNANAK